MKLAKQLVLKALSHLPTKLPKGMTAFHKFADGIFDAYGIPKEDQYYHSIAVMIQHLPPTTVYKSKAWFAASIHNAQAREVAFYKIQELNEKRKAKEEAEKKEAALKEAEKNDLNPAAT